MTIDSSSALVISGEVYGCREYLVTSVYIFRSKISNFVNVIMTIVSYYIASEIFKRSA